MHGSSGKPPHQGIDQGSLKAAPLRLKDEPGLTVTRTEGIERRSRDPQPAILHSSSSAAATPTSKDRA